MENNPENNTFLAIVNSVFKLKFIALIISALLILSGLWAIFLGLFRMYEGVTETFKLIEEHNGTPGLYFIEAIDIFLFSLVVLVMGGGVYKLFVGDKDTFKDSMVFSKIQSFIDLKILLWEALLLMLTVWCALSFFTHSEDLKYELLILPATILLLAIALKFMKSSQNH